MLAQVGGDDFVYKQSVRGKRTRWPELAGYVSCQGLLRSLTIILAAARVELNGSVSDDPDMLPRWTSSFQVQAWCFAGVVICKVPFGNRAAAPYQRAYNFSDPQPPFPYIGADGAR